MNIDSDKMHVLFVYMNYSSALINLIKWKISVYIRFILLYPPLPVVYGFSESGHKIYVHTLNNHKISVLFLRIVVIIKRSHDLCRQQNLSSLSLYLVYIA